MNNYNKTINNLINVMFLQIKRDNINNKNFSSVLYKYLSSNIDYIRDEALKSVNRVYEEEDIKQSIDIFLQKYVLNFKNSLPLFVTELMVKDILIKEVYYIYKNCQILAIKDDYEFIATDSCCDTCKFLANNNVTNELKDFFANDFCKSFIQIKDNIVNTDNLISNNIHIYNVPVKYKNDVASFYKILLLKFNKYFKNKVKIKFVFSDEFEFKYIDNEYLIKFDYKTYKKHFLRALLDFKETPDMVKEIYYKKIANDAKFPDTKFITYLASQNADIYYQECFIAYILTPYDLEEVDNEIFQYFVNHIKQE